jgi:HEAT repeat protein
LVSGLAAQEKKRDDSKSVTNEERRAILAKAEELGAMGAKGVEELAKHLREGNEVWKVAALRELRDLGPDAAPALESILPVLDTKDLGMKMLAIDTLKAIGPKAKKAIPVLIEAAKETKDFDGSIAKRGSSNVAGAALEAVQAIDPDAMPRLAKAMIPGLLEVVEKGRAGAPFSALVVLQQLGPHAKPALPKLKDMLPAMPPRSIGDCLPVFRAVGEDGMAMLADFILDPKTRSEVKVALMVRYGWGRQTTPSTDRILRALLKDEKAEVRAAAVDVLESVRSKELVPALAALLDDQAIPKVPSEYKGEDEFRVARALGNQGKDAVPLLKKALEHKVALARFQATRALGRIGKDAQDAVPALEKLLEDRLPIIQIEAAKAILKTGKESQQAQTKLEDELQAELPRRVAALEAIASLGPSGRPLFAEVKRVVVRSNNPGIQRTGFSAIEAMQPDPKDVARIWAVLLKKNPSFVSFPPKEELREHGKEAQAALPILLDILKSPDVNARRRATEALAAMGPGAEKAIPALIETLDDESSFVADGAVEALGEMGSLAKPAVAPLLRKFEKIKGDDREADFEKRKILTALEGIGPGTGEAVAKLVEWLPKNPQAARVLGRIGPAAKAAVPALERIYKKETGYARAWSAFALVKITGKTEPYVAALAHMFQKSRKPEPRREAVLALAALGPDAGAALPTLMMALKEKGDRDSRDFRREAATAIAHFGPKAKEAVPHLIDMVKTGYYMEQVTAAQALGAIGPDAKAAIPALEQMATEDSRYQRVVERALAKIRAK